MTAPETIHVCIHCKLVLLYGDHSDERKVDRVMQWLNDHSSRGHYAPTDAIGGAIGRCETCRENNALSAMTRMNM